MFTRSKKIILLCLGLMVFFGGCVKKHNKTSPHKELSVAHVHETLAPIESKSCTGVAAADHDQLLVVMLMVKNEGPFMQKTLQPFIDAGINNYFILDTGSTDDTVSVTEELFKKHNITHGYIAKQPFVDFATSRNYALKLAEERFSQAVFFFMIDAEWYTKGVHELIQFCKDHQNLPCLSYGVQISCYTEYSFYMPRLFKAHKGIKFKGAVHEYLTVWDGQRLPDTISISFEPSIQGVEKSRARGKKDCELLLQDHKDNSNDWRTAGLLARTYDFLGKNQCAIWWYKKRCASYGSYEDQFEIHYAFAQLYQKLHKWDLALEHYTKAYIMLPTKSAPFVGMAEICFNRKQDSLCYIFARKAFDLASIPGNELFVQSPLYLYTNAYLLGKTAWMFGDFRLGKKVTRAALEIYPDDALLKANLMHYARHRKIIKK